MYVKHKKHRRCSHACVEEAPWVLGHDSISTWAIGAAAEQRTSWSGWRRRLKNGGNKNYTSVFSIVYIGIQLKIYYERHILPILPPPPPLLLPNFLQCFLLIPHLLFLSSNCSCHFLPRHHHSLYPNNLIVAYHLFSYQNIFQSILWKDIPKRTNGNHHIPLKVIQCAVTVAKYWFDYPGWQSSIRNSVTVVGVGFGLFEKGASLCSPSVHFPSNFEASKIYIFRRNKKLFGGKSGLDPLLTQLQLCRWGQILENWG